MGYGCLASFFLENEVLEEVCIIDLSMDFWVESEDYDFVYGLFELQCDCICLVMCIVNLGCFVIVIQFVLLFLVKNGLLEDYVYVYVVIGFIGVGQVFLVIIYFSWCNNNIFIYKVFWYQYLQEIGQSVCMLQFDFDLDINFLLLWGNFFRGIYVSIYLYMDLKVGKVIELFEEFYVDFFFVFCFLINLDFKQVVNMNKGIVYFDWYEGKFFIVSMIDNLFKGVFGQVV